MKRKIFLIILVIISLVIFVSCQGSEPSETNDSDTETVETEESPMEEEMTEVMLELTLEELSDFNGKDGSRAYVAVDGTIYDVTDVDEWQNGMHNGVEAGNDLTDEIMNQSPHGTSTLSKAEIVGKLIE